MEENKKGAQGAPLLPKRKYIRLPPEAYANPASTFNVTIDALERRKHFDLPIFNDEVVGLLHRLAGRYRSPIKIYCLMPTHLHMMIKPGLRSIVGFIGEFKNKTADLARKTRGIDQLWQRSFFDHRLRSSDSEIE